MEKILILTNHPSPYMNRWFQIIEKEYNIYVLYYFHKAIYKKWNNFVPYEGQYLIDMNLFQIAKFVLNADFVILCGINKFKYVFSLILLLLFKKQFAIYSDYPENSKPKFFLFRQLLFKKFVPYFFCATSSACEFISTSYKIDIRKFFIFPYAHNFSSNNIENVNLKSVTKEYMKIKLFTANSFYNRKGYDTLYKSLKMLKDNSLLDKFKIRIAGVGDDYDLYKKLFSQLSSEIELLGWVEDHEYNLLMRETDVYIHPSDFEPFGIPPLDAMENAKLLISTTGVKSVEKIINNGVNGYLIKPGDYIGLYAILNDLTTDKVNIRQIGNNALQTVRSFYPKDKIIQALKSCIR